jgi:HEAT repeat protein
MSPASPAGSLEVPARTAAQSTNYPQYREIPHDEQDSASLATQTRLRLKSKDPRERAKVLGEIALIGGFDSFNRITQAFDDDSIEVRNAAARALYQLRVDRSSSFIRAFKEAPPDRGRRIASAVADCGLAAAALVDLSSENRDKAYDAFSLLFLIAKAGEIELLLQAVEEHSSIEIRRALVQLLAQSEHKEVLPAFCRLAVRQSLPSEVRSSLMEAIHQIRSEHLKTLPPDPLLPGTSKNK